MTAASGIIHKEVCSQAFAETGGSFEMIQLPAQAGSSTLIYMCSGCATFPTEEQKLEDQELEELELEDQDMAVMSSHGGM